MTNFKKLRVLTLVMLGLLTFSCQNDDDIITQQPTDIKQEETKKMMNRS